jgi:hypothetical protein
VKCASARYINSVQLRPLTTASGPPSPALARILLRMKMGYVCSCPVVILFKYVKVMPSYFFNFLFALYLTTFDS